MKVERWYRNIKVVSGSEVNDKERGSEDVNYLFREHKFRC